MRRNAIKKVAVSALALCALYGSPALAQIVINCPSGLDIGNHAACSSGSLVINPDGSTSLTGCLVTEIAPQIGQCLLSTGGVPLTRSVRVDFTRSTSFIKFGGKDAKVNNFRLQPTTATAPAAHFTFTPAQVGAGILMNVGGTLHFTDGQALGSYTGTIGVEAVLL